MITMLLHRLMSLESGQLLDYKAFACSPTATRFTRRSSCSQLNYFVSTCSKASINSIESSYLFSKHNLSLQNVIMVSVLNLIGGASGFATLFDFIIPDSSPAERGNSLVTVQVGLDGTPGDDGGLDGAGGNFPLVTLFNNNMDLIGQTQEPDMFATEIGSGAFATLEIGTGSG